MLEYIKRVRETQEENSNIQNVLIAFNNHFAGFGPQSVNDFLKLMNISEIEWKTELENYENNSGQSNGRHQSNLSDFTQQSGPQIIPTFHHGILVFEGQ